MTTCYACASTATASCPRCGTAYCSEHGGEICARCANPAAGPSQQWYRGSLLAFALASAVGLWLLVVPPDLTGSDAPEGPSGPVGAPVATEQPTDGEPTGTPPAEATSTPGGGEQRYTVQAGDTLVDIASQFGTTPEDIMEANNLDSEIIQPGQELVIPE
ncbi:MAG TPA: LysM peptidoglycan-binding domain-containing protein [Dehalococcoidia bacterium]|nr:LysM peptidoglycan-binding domain-containing protein [Dehalococcoidia bacterium]